MMRRKRDIVERCRNACRGFTLFEVLIAISLLALISILVVSTLRFGFTAWRNSDDTLSAMQDVSFAQQFLRQSLSSAYPRLAGEGVQAVEFTGQPTEVSFVGPAPLSVARAARAYINIRVVETRHGLSIVADIRPELVRSDLSDAVVRETLVDGLNSIRFSYRAAGDTDWRDVWIDESRLPALVRIEAEAANRNRMVWPELIIATQIDVDASCRYDRLTKYCQGRRR